MCQQRETKTKKTHIMKKEVKNCIMSPDLVGELRCYYLCPDGLYHWGENESYAGYTAEELDERWKDYRQ